MLTAFRIALLLAALAPGLDAQDAAVDEPFPPSTALAEGVSPDALADLEALVRKLVEGEEVVGAELHVIVHGRTILHEAYGWRDREAGEPLETGGVYCVRSMTKPLIGAAILMLVDGDELDLDDRVAEYLPSFDAGATRGITVEQLLTHTSGLPMSLILAEDPRELESLRAVADLGGGHELAFEPGTGFAYSDQGTDTLAALIEVVTGAPAEDFVRARLLEPLGMRESACRLEDSPLRARALPAYAGSKGAWSAFWRPEEPPLFPVFLGSQGLYSTTTDYARFLRLWLERGRAGGERLLRARSVRRALRPGPHPMQAPTGFPGLRADYGCLMQLWTAPADDADDGREVVAFGHTGSDGTHAWAFPERDAMVLYFTQSRGNPTGLRLEEALGALFLGVPFDPNLAAPPLEPYLGFYWEGEGDLYRAVVREGDGLGLEILGKAVVPLTYAGDDRWKMPDPSTVLAFARAESGEVTGYSIGDHREYRFEPSPELPGADEIAARVAAAHRLDLLETLGPLRLTSEVSIGGLGLTGEATVLYAWPDRFRFDSRMRDEHERLAFDGEALRHAPPNAPPEEPVRTIEGPRAELLRPDQSLARFGDWHRWYGELRTIQRLEGPGGEEVLLVRAGDLSGPGRTLWVHAASGRLLREDALTHVDTLGRIGQSLEFGDYREISGMWLPFRTEIELATPMIGTIVTTVTAAEVGVEVPAGAFELAD